MFKLNLQKLVGGIDTSYISGATSITNMPLGTDTNFLEDMLPNVNEKSLNAIYREIYLFDTVSGPTVDLMSTLPWSNFTLSGITDKKVLQIFEDSVGELDTINLLKQVAVSYLVLGKVIGSLIFNEKKGIFTDVIFHNPDDCEIQPIPLRGYDPKIDLKVPKETKKFLRSKDPRDREALKELSTELIAKLIKGTKIPLEPLSTLYLTRSQIPGVDSISYYTRILPIWLIEKALMRGTIIGSWRRQRSILHIIAGDDTWEASDTQLAAINNLFKNADKDPQGAIIVTRPGITSEEIRSPTDFWKVTEDWDTFSNAKMKAFGVGDAFLSGEANYATMEVALSVFIENLKSFRNQLTKDVIYDKIFLMLAKYHNFQKRTQAELTHRVRINTNTDTNINTYNGPGALSLGSRNLAESAKFLIPTLQWHKDLTPRSDASYADLLNTASEKGIPVPLALLASASGIDFQEDILNNLESDIENRKKIKVFTEKLKKEGLESKEEEGF